MKKLLPIILGLIGIGAGIGAGLALRPAPEVAMEGDPCGDQAVQVAQKAPVEETAKLEVPETEFAKLNNQFIVPVVDDGLVNSLVVLSISIEVGLDQSEAVYAREPKLRDAFLQVLFDHASIGGFDGNFTNSSNLGALRKALQETASDLLPGISRDVLITEIIRQDA